MAVVRNRLSLSAAGGPRQFGELRDRVLIQVGREEERTNIKSKLEKLGFSFEELKNAPVITAEPREKIEDVVEKITDVSEMDGDIREGIKEISKARDSGEDVIDASQDVIDATESIVKNLKTLKGVRTVEFVKTQADFGPENLRFTPDDLADVKPAEASEKENNLQDMLEDKGVPEAWKITRGENAAVCIFDTGFSKNLIDSSRVKGTFHAGGTDSAFESSEGHGTMTAGATAANSDEGVPYDGVAPEADVYLVRCTDSKGQFRGDIISKGWDWLANRNTRKPIVSNHSYGTPLCSGRPRTKFCDTVENDVIRTITSDSDITAVYAAGNEAMRCGHRHFGFTNAVTGTNSIQEVVTVGALLSSGKEAQRYSSHGRGDCAPVSDPKPNVSCRIPVHTYYGGENGYTIKDMSTGLRGSSGGTSHASPMTAGMIALLQSAAVKPDRRGKALQTEEVKQIIQGTAERPRRTLVNSTGLLIGEKDYDARYGHGEWDVNAALNEV